MSTFIEGNREDEIILTDVFYKNRNIVNKR
jgi:hypothetical protein